jgi:hypothetical protein
MTASNYIYIFCIGWIDEIQRNASLLFTLLLLFYKVKKVKLFP